MADLKKREDEKVLIVEFNVSMHCNACERSVAKAISKIKGVEQFMTDMPRQRVVIIGEINPEKVVKKIKKKTGKRAEIVCSKEEDSQEEEEDFGLQGNPAYLIEAWGSSYLLDTEVCTMFSDENPNSCSIL